VAVVKRARSIHSLCANICSVTSQGHPHARFRRALSTGKPRLAETAADALELCLSHRGEPERYERGLRRAAGLRFREAVHSDRGVVLLRECLVSCLVGGAPRRGQLHLRQSSCRGCKMRLRQLARMKRTPGRSAIRVVQSSGPWLARLTWCRSRATYLTQTRTPTTQITVPPNTATILALT